MVVEDETSSRALIALAHEDIETYDPAYYETQLVRAVENVLSSLGWKLAETPWKLAETHELDLTPFTGFGNE